MENITNDNNLFYDPATGKLCTSRPANDKAIAVDTNEKGEVTFTAYIFQEDVQKLHREAGSTEQKSGSLFGLWTSTGNPVVRYVVSAAVHRADSERYGTKLWDGYRLCHIGEWRLVRSQRARGQTVQDTGRHLLSNFKGGKPERFLVLDVEVTDIKPFLFEGENQRRRGKLELLEGENPFNRPDIDAQQSTEQHLYQSSHHRVQSSAGQGRDWLRPQPRPQLKPAITRKYQWYSDSVGNGTFEKILNDFKRIAYQGQVEITRNKTTEDLSMAFKDKRRLKKWQVDFPYNFPLVGALLIEDPDSRSKCKKYPQVTNTDQIQAVRKMTDCIERPFLL